MKSVELTLAVLATMAMVSCGGGSSNGDNANTDNSTPSTTTETPAATNTPATETPAAPTGGAGVDFFSLGLGFVFSLRHSVPLCF